MTAAGPAIGRPPWIALVGLGVLVAMVVYWGGCSSTSPGVDNRRAMSDIRDELERSVPHAVAWAAYGDTDVRDVFIDAQYAAEPGHILEARLDDHVSFVEFRAFPEIQDFLNFHRSQMLTPFLEEMGRNQAEPTEAYQYILEHVEPTLVASFYADPALRVVIARQPEADPGSISRDDFEDSPAVAEFVAPIVESVEDAIRAVVIAHQVPLN